MRCDRMYETATGCSTCGKQGKKDNEPGPILKTTLALLGKTGSHVCDHIKGPIWLGDLRAVYDWDPSFTHVVSVVDGLVQLPKLEASHLRIPMLDDPKEGPRVATELAKVVAFVEEASKHPDAKVLIHCVQGISRSGTMTIGVLMLVYGMTYDEALKTTRAARPCVLPNPGFVTALKALK